MCSYYYDDDDDDDDVVVVVVVNLTVYAEKLKQHTLHSNTIKTLYNQEPTQKNHKDRRESYLPQQMG
jgi:hypothetical protein